MYRAYVLKHHINRSKLLKIDDIVRAYRVTAKNISDLIWREFYLNSEIKRFYPLKEVGSIMSERYKQVCLNQVLGMINSYLSNRKNEFKNLVYRSSVKDEKLKRDLFYINRYGLWFNNKIKVKERLIPLETIKLARKIISHTLDKNRVPSMAKIGLMLDAKVATITEANDKSSFDYWVKLSTLNRGKTIMLPLKSNDYFANIKGEITNFIQINPKGDTKIEVALLKEIEKQEYIPKRERIALDLGLKTLIATSDGDLMARGFYSKLQYYDKKISVLVKILQKSGIKPRSSKRYRTLVFKLKSYLKNEMNRVMNRVVAIHKPSIIAVERLNFQGSNLSRRLNRLLSNFGKGVLRDKLNSLNELYGIKIEQVNPAYTSQTCISCGYVSRKNRKTRDEFTCGYCGKKHYSDVSSAKNIGVRSSNGLSDIFLSKQLTLGKLVREFIERHKGFYSNRPVVTANPYFAHVFKETVSVPPNKRIS